MAEVINCKFCAPTDENSVGTAIVKILPTAAFRRRLNEQVKNGKFRYSRYFSLDLELVDRVYVPVTELSIIVKNLPQTTCNNDLDYYFWQFGKVEESEIYQIIDFDPDEGSDPTATPDLVARVTFQDWAGLNKCLDAKDYGILSEVLSRSGQGAEAETSMEHRVLEVKRAYWIPEKFCVPNKMDLWDRSDCFRTVFEEYLVYDCSLEYESLDKIVTSLSRFGKVEHVSAIQMVSGTAFGSIRVVMSGKASEIRKLNQARQISVHEVVYKCHPLLHWQPGREEDQSINLRQANLKLPESGRPNSRKRKPGSHSRNRNKTANFSPPPASISPPAYKASGDSPAIPETQRRPKASTIEWIHKLSIDELERLQRRNPGRIFESASPIAWTDKLVPGKPLDEYQCYVTKLSDRIDQESLIQHFSKFGKVLYIEKRLRRRDDVSSREYLVTFADLASANRCRWEPTVRQAVDGAAMKVRRWLPYDDGRERAVDSESEGMIVRLLIENVYTHEVHGSKNRVEEDVNERLRRKFNEIAHLRLRTLQTFWQIPQNSIDPQLHAVVKFKLPEDLDAVMRARPMWIRIGGVAHNLDLQPVDSIVQMKLDRLRDEVPPVVDLTNFGDEPVKTQDVCGRKAGIFPLEKDVPLADIRQHFACYGTMEELEFVEVDAVSSGMGGIMAVATFREEEAVQRMLDDKNSRQIGKSIVVVKALNQAEEFGHSDNFDGIAAKPARKSRFSSMANELHPSDVASRSLQECLKKSVGLDERRDEDNSSPDDILALLSSIADDGRQRVVEDYSNIDDSVDHSRSTGKSRKCLSKWNSGMDTFVYENRRPQDGSPERDSSRRRQGDRDYYEDAPLRSRRRLSRSPHNAHFETLTDFDQRMRTRSRSESPEIFEETSPIIEHSGGSREASVKSQKSIRPSFSTDFSGGLGHLSNQQTQSLQQASAAFPGGQKLAPIAYVLTSTGLVPICAPVSESSDTSVSKETFSPSQIQGLVNSRLGNINPTNQRPEFVQGLLSSQPEPSTIKYGQTLGSSLAPLSSGPARTYTTSSSISSYSGRQFTHDESMTSSHYDRSTDTNLRKLELDKQILLEQCQSKSKGLPNYERFTHQKLVSTSDRPFSGSLDRSNHSLSNIRGERLQNFDDRPFVNNAHEPSTSYDVIADAEMDISRPNSVEMDDVDSDQDSADDKQNTLEEDVQYVDEGTDDLHYVGSSGKDYHRGGVVRNYEDPDDTCYDNLGTRSDSSHHQRNRYSENEEIDDVRYPKHTRERNSVGGLLEKIRATKAEEAGRMSWFQRQAAEKRAREEAELRELAESFDCGWDKLRREEKRRRQERR